MAIDIKEYLTPPILLILFLLVISLMFIFPVLNMIVLGAILAYLVRPVALKIQSKLKFSSISILLAMVIVLIPLILLLAYILFEISGFCTGILSTKSSVDLNATIAQLSVYVPIDSNSINSYIGDIAKYALNYSVSFLSKFLNIYLDLFILVCSVFYFVRDGDDCLE
ncbi:MAG: AI-2E family transporter, partial [Methanobrevibacter sp.]|nr:AI-2E family transporter [Methanobrevibacter sp.]